MGHSRTVFVKPDTTKLLLSDVHQRAAATLRKRQSAATRTKKLSDLELRRLLNELERKAEDADGDYVIIRSRLNHGEQCELFDYMSTEGADGFTRINRRFAATGKLAAYLVDWSFSDDLGPLSLRDLDFDGRVEVIKNLDPDVVTEIRQAIDDHIEATDAARSQRKNEQDGETVSAATLPSAG